MNDIRIMVAESSVLKTPRDFNGSKYFFAKFGVCQRFRAKFLDQLANFLNVRVIGDLERQLHH